MHQHLVVLRGLVAELTDLPSPWALTGSLSLAIQGLPVVPRDVDVQTDRRGAYDIAHRFAANVIRPVRFSAADRIRSHFGAVLLDGITVEIMGDVEKRLADGTWEQAADISRIRHVVEYDGIRVPLLRLEHECDAYRKLGRVERADLIERWLARE
jgi:hypothetical protein